MTEYRFSYASQPELADRALDDLLEVLTQYALEEHLRQGLSLAVSEAFTNAAIHGNRGRTDRDVHMILHVRESEVVADIIDHGKGGIEQIEARKTPSELDEGGRGVDLIRYYADSAHFTETEDGGLKVSMVFVRTGQKTMKK